MLYCLSLARSMKSSSQTELWVIASTDQPRWSTFNCHRWERFVICGEPDLASGRLNLYHGIAPIHKICIHLSDFVSNCSLIIVGKTIFAIIFAAFLFSPEQDCQQAGGEHWSRAQKKISDTDCGYHGCYHSVTRAKQGKCDHSWYSGNWISHTRPSLWQLEGVSISSVSLLYFQHML